MSLKILPSIFEAWGNANFLTRGKAEEDSAITGCNPPLAILSQIPQASAFYADFSKLLELSKKTHYLFLGMPMAFLIPIPFGILEYYKHTYPQLDFKIVRWLHVNLGSICQIASVITALALLKLGCVAYALTSLTILSLGYLSRRHCLPLFIEKRLSSVSPWIGNIGTVLYGNWFLKLFALINLSERIYIFFFQKQQISYDKVPETSHLSDLHQFDQIYWERAKVEVNRDHVWIAPFPPATDDFNPLITFCDRYEWPSDRLEQSLEKDARWLVSEQKTLYERATAEKKQIAIEYAKSNLKTLVRSIQNKDIHTGQILDYGVLENYLGYITEKLPLASRKLQDDIMIQLAVEGGEYCGPGVYFQLESAATALLLNQQSEEKQRLPLKQRILLLLQQERLRVIEGFHIAISKISPGVHVWHGGKKDIHSLNRTIELLGSDFGLPDQGAMQDKTAEASKLEKWIAQYITVRLFPEDLWTGIKYGNTGVQGYNVERIINALKAQMGLPLIPNPDIYAWATHWIKKDPANEEAFIERLMNVEFESFDQQIHETFLKAMLVDMGIFKIKKNI